MEPNTDLSEKKKIRTSRMAGWRRALAVFGLFWYALLGWLRLYETLVYRDYLTKLNIWPRPAYILASGAVIGTTFTMAIILVLLKARFAPAYVRWLGGVFLAWLWFDHIWFSTPAAFFSQVLVLSLITGATLLIMFVLVKKRDYRREAIHGDQ
jgi:hypothetical protein